MKKTIKCSLIFALIFITSGCIPRLSGLNSTKWMTTLKNTLSICYDGKAEVAPDDTDDIEKVVKRRMIEGRINEPVVRVFFESVQDYRYIIEKNPRSDIADQFYISIYLAEKDGDNKTMIYSGSFFKMGN